MVLKLIFWVITIGLEVKVHYAYVHSSAFTLKPGVTVSHEVLDGN